MAAGNEVRLVFAGDATSLQRTFQTVGSDAKSMASKVDAASKDTKAGFDRVGSAADASESKFMGMADVLDGLGGAFGIPTEGATNMMRSFGDLTGGFAQLQPLIGTVGTALKSGLGGALSFIAAHPVMLTIALLTAAFVLLWQHSETFRDIVRGVFDKVGGFVGGLWDKFKNLVGNIKGLGQQIVEVVTWPYRTAFNGIADIWNNTVGRLSFKVPSWVPGIGGNGFDIPDIPKFHSGGVVPGAPGSETLALLQAGERVIPAGGGGGVVINVYAPNYVGSKDELGRAVTEALRDYRFRNGMN